MTSHAPPEAVERARWLREEIARLDYAYYVLAEPLVPDAEYDRLFRELVALETRYPELVTPDSPTQRVGGKPAPEFAEVRHEVPMLSLTNAYTDEEVFAFDRRCRELLGIERIFAGVEPLALLCRKLAKLLGGFVAKQLDGRTQCVFEVF